MKAKTQELTIAALENQRHSCLQCGWCCRWWRVEVTPAERGRLQAYDWGSVRPRLAGARLFDEYRLPGRFSPVIQTTHDMGQCVFLDDDGLCIIHKTLGEDAKPSTCRRFPVVVGYGTEGVIVGADYSCLATARNEGRPFTDVVDESSTLLLEHARSHHWEPVTSVLIDDEIEADWDGYMALEYQLVRLLSRQAMPVMRRLHAGNELFSSIAAWPPTGPLATRGRVNQSAKSLDFGKASGDGVSGSTPAASLLSPADLAPMIGDVEAPHTRFSGRGSRSIGYAMSVAAGHGRIYLATLRTWVDLGKSSAVECDLDSPEAAECIVRFLRNYVLRRTLLRSVTIAAGWEYLTTCLSLVRWYAAASASISGRTTASRDDVIQGILVVEKAYVP